MTDQRSLANTETVRLIIEEVVDVVDKRRERERVQTTETLSDLQARVAKLEGADRVNAEVRVTRDREIRDVKETVNGMDTKLDTLLADKAGRDTAISWAKWLIGTGFFGVVGSVIVATLHYIGVLRPPG